MSITNTELRKIKAPYTGKPEITDTNGLTVRITKKAVITFNFRFQWFGKPQRMSIGRYPEVMLSEARAQVIKLRRAVFDGDDPRYLGEVYTEQSLFGNIAKEYLSLRVDKDLSPKSQTLYHSTYNKYIKPMATINVETFSYRQWISYFDKINHDTSPANAGSILKRFKTLIRWAKSRGRISKCSLLDIPTSAVGCAQGQRERVLEWHECAHFWREVEMSRTTLATKTCIKLLMLTFARNSEIREASVCEFDLERRIWILPANRSKTKKPVRRALSDQVISLIKSLDPIYGKSRALLIPGQKKDKPLSAHALNRFVQRLNDKMNVEQFVPHDFRRTGATRLSENGVMPHVIEKMLGHELGGILAIYNKHDWIDEQLVAYTLFSKILNDKLQQD
ncbi:tyrosine-type recombinase/integrase [Moritella dasanensis]|uniref:tyrosine-type recombinase/integrase n=1 Tax=Moritella dasanensis TaxID=428031 RepID=UPI0003708A67|nr:site-specific integrase [Moritella dasanensis]